MTELIAVNVGNSRIACGRFVDGELADIWHYQTQDALRAAQGIHEKAHAGQVAMCSVVPSSGRLMRDYWQSRHLSVHEIRGDTQTLISGTYETMGADRIANAAAAWKLYGQNKPCLVIDLGTATTLTAVSAAGQFLGGFITLGLESTLRALHRGTAQLPDVDLSDDHYQPPTLAATTYDAIASGTLFAHVGLVEYWLALSKTQLGQPITTVATGGWSALLANYTQIFDKLDSELALKGICLIAQAAEVPADPD